MPSKDKYAKVRNRNSPCKSKLKSRAKAKSPCPSKCAESLAFGPEIGCCSRATATASISVPSAAQAHSKNIAASALLELDPAERRSIAGCGKCAENDDDSPRYQCGRRVLGPGHIAELGRAGRPGIRLWAGKCNRVCPGFCRTDSGSRSN